MHTAVDHVVMPWKNSCRAAREMCRFVSFQSLEQPCLPLHRRSPPDSSMAGCHSRIFAAIAPTLSALLATLPASAAPLTPFLPPPQDVAA